jgi:hypothetical protein
MALPGTFIAALTYSNKSATKQWKSPVNLSHGSSRAQESATD